MADADGPLAVVAIDIPIGLARPGTAASRRAGPKAVGTLTSSVFMTPTRATLDAPDHRTASARNHALTGEGISRQVSIQPSSPSCTRWSSGSPDPPCPTGLLAAAARPGAKTSLWPRSIRTGGYATALRTQLPDAIRVLNAFHITRLGLAAVDRSAAASSRTSCTAAGSRRSIYRIWRLLRRAPETLSERAWAPKRPWSAGLRVRAPKPGS